MQTSSGRWVNLPRPLPRQPWPTTSLGDREEIREGVVESSEVALLQQAVASLQRAMSVLVEDTAASQVQAAAMEEAAQVQLAAVEAGAEASRVQVQRAMSVLVKEKAAAQVQAAAMAEEAQVQLVEVEARVEAEKRRADIAEAQVLQVQDRLATVTWRLGEREEQGDSCYNELAQVQREASVLNAGLQRQMVAQEAGLNEELDAMEKRMRWIEGCLQDPDPINCFNSLKLLGLDTRHWVTMISMPRH